MKKKFIVLGGGTAGWITALNVQQLFPEHEVTVVYSEEKGVVGVGEATTPHMVEFLLKHDINLADFITAVGGSIKNGISFENWNGDNKKYFHPFGDDLVDFSVPGIFEHSSFDYYLKTLISNKLPFEEYVYLTKLAYSNKVDVENSKFAIHFDTNKCSKYLENVAIQKNIKTIVGDFKQAIQDNDDRITQIVLTDDSIVDCDFVFDCTGFHRVLIGGVYNQSWISYKEHLPMKKAITFWLEPEEDWPPYTSAIAMKYGWMWKIPLQDRMGCGYVYDSDYINEDQARQEAEEYYGRSVKIRKIIDFDAGRYNNIWVKNCIAVGLSGSFLEPLESTSIWSQITLLETLKHFLNDIDDLNQKNIDLFNELIGNDVDEKMNFIYLHYLTKRNDSDFWKEFREKNSMPKLINEILSIIKKGDLKYHYLHSSKIPAGFPLMSYLWICTGLDMFEKNIKTNNYKNLKPSVDLYKQIIEVYLENAPNHKLFLTSQ
jgi:tryptophan halogenase